MQSIIKPVTIINSFEAEYVNIQDTSETYHDTDTVLTGRARRATSHLFETDQQATNVRLQDDGFSTFPNEMHHIKHNRTVNSDDTQGYQDNSEDSHRSDSYQNNGNHTKHDIPPKNTSTFSRCFEAIKIGCSFFTSLRPTVGNKLGDINLRFKPIEMASSLVSLCYPCATFMLQCGVFLCTASHSGASDNINTPPSSDRKTASTNPDDMSDIPKDIPKDINNIEMLNKVGRDPGFPSNGAYRLTDNIDGRGFTAPMDRFSGILDGNGYAISGLGCCLVITLSGNAVIKNLIVSGANIHHSTCSSVITVFMTDHSRIEFVTINDCHVTSTPLQYGHDAIVTELMKSYACINNVHVQDCTVTMRSRDGVGGCLSGGMTEHAESVNNTIKNCNITSEADFSSTGSLFGYLWDDAKSSNDYVSEFNGIANGFNVHAGIATGYMDGGSIIKNATFANSTVIANGPKSGVAIVPSSIDDLISHQVTYRQSTISDSTAINCKITANASRSRASLWTLADSKYLKVENCKDINCTINTAGPSEMTTTEQTVSAPLAPLLLIGGGAVLGATFLGAIAVCVGYSLRNGYKDGKHGRALLMHPLNSCIETLYRFYQRCRGNSLLLSTIDDMEMTEIS